MKPAYFIFSIIHLMNKIIISAFWIFIVLLILLSSNNSSYPILNYKTQKTISTLFPQGWGFFTKDPKDATIDVYELQGKTLKLVTVNNFSQDNLFGFSRKSRYIGYELGKLGACIPKAAYKNEIGMVCKKFQSKATVVKIPFKPRFYSLNKEFVIYQYKIVPFEWINKKQEQYRPYLVARVKFVYSPTSNTLKKQFKAAS